MIATKPSTASHGSSLPVAEGQDGRKGPRLTSLRRKMAVKLQKAQGSLNRLMGRVVYSLPLISRHDPRRRMTTIKGHCRQTTGFIQQAGPDSHDWYITVRPPETLHRNVSICLNEREGARFRESTERFQNGNHYILPEVSLACLHNARIYSKDFLVITGDKRILADSAFSNREVLEANGVCDKVFWPRAKRMKGSYCLLANPWASAYYHWVIDILPRLSLIESHGESERLPCIVPQALSPFQRDSLDLAGVSSDRRIHFDGGNWEMERLFFPALLGPPGNPSPHAVAWLRSRFLPPGPPTSTGRGRWIYLTRRDAPQRRVLNEAEIAAYLVAQGFEIICPGDLSFAEQVRIFSEASFVVAPHGAGLTNMVFAPPGSALVEFFGDNYINGCYWALANICQHRHAFLTGPATGLNYHISLESLKILLQRVGLS